MDNMVVLEMLMDKKIADEVMEKGLAEIALRRADAKFKTMIKCKVLGTSIEGENIPEKLVSEAMQLSINKNMDLAAVKNTLYSLEKGTGVLTTTAKDIANQVDGIYQQVNSVMNISYLNTGIVLANTAVDVIGFIVVTEKLNTLNAEVQIVKNEINKITNLQKNEKIGICQNLIMRCNAMITKIKDDEEIDLDKLQDLLIDMRSFISEMVMNLQDQSLGETLVLKIVYTLIPAYTALFYEFLKRYYFQKNSIPVNYEMFFSLYTELKNENFIQKLQDYYYLHEKLHVADVLDILNAQVLIGLNGMIQIEDQLAILKAFETKEKVLLFEDCIDHYAEKRIKDAIPILAKTCDIDEKECFSFFNL